MLSFDQFIVEGGNVKIGDAHAGPIKVTARSRSSRTADIHQALSHLHDSMNKEHGIHLFGKNKSGLKSGSVYSGSTGALMNHRIPHNEFAKHKPNVGDIDVAVSKEHRQHLENHLKTGRKFGKYTVKGFKRHGNEISTVMKHDNGEHHQMDFEFVKHGSNGEPTKGERFTHGSPWDDIKAGMKGMHHKRLLNAAGGDSHKFSITHGVRSRTDPSDPGNMDPKHVTRKLFGANADHKQASSFLGVTQLIKKHIHPSKHQAIYDKFKGKGYPSDGPALAHLKKHLSVN